MLFKICYFFLFAFFLELHSKELIINLEAEFPDKTTISIFYFDQVQDFTMSELIYGVEKAHVCDVIFYSNMKGFLDLTLSSKSIKENLFCFVNKDIDKKIPFYLFKKGTKDGVFNGSTLYKRDNLKECINTVISLGLCIPGVEETNLSAGALSSHFIINLKQVG